MAYDACERLFLAEAFGLLNGVVEFLNELLVGLVWRKVESVEAGMAARQPCLLADFLDAEMLRPVAPCMNAKVYKYFSEMQ